MKLKILTLARYLWLAVDQTPGATLAVVLTGLVVAPVALVIAAVMVCWELMARKCHLPAPKDADNDDYRF